MNETGSPNPGLVRLSKLLGLLLRHRPDRFPFEMDEDGYAAVADILRLVQGLSNFRWVTRTDLEAAVELPGRRRYEIVGDRIRALYGHTAVRLDYPSVEPPPFLYHGTAPQNLARIRSQGLRAMARQFVHMAIAPDLARATALRYTDDPVVLRVRAGEAHARGILFYQPVPEVYLSPEIPADFLDWEF